MKSYKGHGLRKFSLGTVWPLIGRRARTERIKTLFKKINLLIYLFLAVLGLCCCAWAFSSCGKGELLFAAVHRLLIAVASLVVEHRL